MILTTETPLDKEQIKAYRYSIDEEKIKALQEKNKNTKKKVFLKNKTGVEYVFEIKTSDAKENTYSIECDKVVRKSGIGSITPLDINNKKERDNMFNMLKNVCKIENFTLDF